MKKSEIPQLQVTEIIGNHFTEFTELLYNNMGDSVKSPHIF